MTDTFHLYQPPFSYTEMVDKSFRIQDQKDNALARTYTEENAALVVGALNFVYKQYPNAFQAFLEESKT
jgi:hypothetical protein